MEQLTQHQGQLFGYIFSLVHDWEDTRDIFQQTSLVLWGKFDTFEPNSNFAAWACVAARYTAMNFLRAKQRAESRLSDTLLDEVAVEFESASPSDMARRTALASCLQKLSELDRQLVELCYSPQASIKEVGKLLGRSSPGICKSLRRIREKLFECIDRTLAQEEFS
jgi:RNA polymerase sigma-70 factor (ECF subfamily)